MSNPVEIQPVPSQLAHAVEDVFSGVLPMVEQGDLGKAFAVAGELKGVMSFDPAELPAGSRYVPFDRDDPDLMELPPYIHGEQTDAKLQAQQIAQNVGSILVSPEAPGIVSIQAPDGGVHKFLTLQPDSLLTWLGTKGYTASNLPKALPEEALEMGTPSPVVAAESPMEQTTVIPRIEAGPSETVFPISEQLQTARRVLDRMAPQLAGRYELTQAEVEHALDRVWFNYRGLREVFNKELTELTLDEVTSRVVRAAFQEIVRVAPRGPEYDEALLSGKRIAGFDLAAQAAESIAIQPYLTILADTPAVPRRRRLTHDATRPALPPVVSPHDTQRISAKEILPPNFVRKSISFVKRGLTALNSIRRRILPEA